MERKKTIFDFGAEVLMIFAVTMIFMMCFTAAVGDNASEISKLYSLGSKGLSVTVMAQFLLLSVLVAVIKYICLSQFLQSKLPELIRTILMMAAIVAVMAVYAAALDWFPITMWQPWAVFLVCFALCTGGTFGIVFLRVRMENKKMEEDLKFMRRQWEEEENGKDAI